MDDKRNSKLPQIGIVTLGELPMHVWCSDQTTKNIIITESPYYIALNENNPAVFLAYQETMRGLPSAASEISWDQFLDLRNDIAEHGLRDIVNRPGLIGGSNS